MKNIKISKFLSLVLRHKPETIGLNMDENGWVDLDELIKKMNLNGKSVNLDQIVEVVETNSKQRFKLDQANNRIRANQGHSLSVDVELNEKTPPDILYHGTATRNVDVITREGLKKMNRQHVHLSIDFDTAMNVGTRHGKPIILKVNCKRMSEDGIQFYLSENEVWLTDYVAPEYIEELR